VGGIPDDCTPLDLKERFKHFGEIIKVSVHPQTEQYVNLKTEIFCLVICLLKQCEAVCIVCHIHFLTPTEIYLYPN